jgi:hypothetical protein
VKFVYSAVRTTTYVPGQSYNTPGQSYTYTIIIRTREGWEASPYYNALCESRRLKQKQRGMEENRGEASKQDTQNFVCVFGFRVSHSLRSVCHKHKFLLSYSIPLGLGLWVPRLRFGFSWRPWCSDQVVTNNKGGVAQADPTSLLIKAPAGRWVATEGTTVTIPVSFIQVGPLEHFTHTPTYTRMARGSGIFSYHTGVLMINM